ncbi:MAG: S-layer homology domain-containing protein [Faecousia sp.]
MKKHSIGTLILLVFCMALLSMTVLAAENVSYLDETGAPQTCASATEVTSSDTEWGASGETTWYVAQGTEPITISNGVTFSGDVHLILADGCNLTVNGGISGEASANLTIYAQSTGDNMGKLTAIGSDVESGSSYGIYAHLGSGANGGNITINGGTVEAKGGTASRDSCGIFANGNYNYDGSGEPYVGGNITISGNARVTATGGKTTFNSCGIYSVGYFYDWENWLSAGGNITISGNADVTVNGGASIRSCGIYTGLGTLTVNGGTVEANGGEAVQTEGPTNYPHSYGIYANKISVNGGSVTATGGDTDSYYGSQSYGICANYDDIKISGGTVNAYGGASQVFSYGICAEFDSITISGGTVNAYGGKSQSSWGIAASFTVEISGGSVTATGDTAEEESCGIFAYDAISISDTADVTATGGKAANRSYGICAVSYYDSYQEQSVGGIILISGTAKVKANGGEMTGEDSKSYGIFAQGTITISDTPDITAIGGNSTADSSESYGICAAAYDNYGQQQSVSGTITISGGTVIARSGKSHLSWGIGASDAIVISGGSVNATGGEATEGSGVSYGIAATSVTISNTAKVDAEGSTAGEQSCGLYAYSAIEISGGSVTAKGGNAGRNSYGIYSYKDDIAIAGGTVIAQGGTATGESGASCGIYARDDISISDTADITATGGDTTGESGESCGIVASGITFSGGHVTARTLAESAAVKAALSVEPTLPDAYWWRTDAKSCYTEGNFVWKDDPYDTYVEITDTEPTYTITFDTDGGSEIAPITLPYGAVVTAPADPTKTGHTFAGWEPELPKTMPAENLTIKALWTVNPYTVTVENASNGSVTADRNTAVMGDTVTLTVKPDKAYTLETLSVTDGKGNDISVTNLGDGKYTFTMPASNVTVNATFMEDNTMLNFFVDVPVDAYYYDAVLWAAEKGITNGTSDTTFSPDAPCTRAQVVTFLWRAAGCPTPNSSEMPFTDVVAGSYYEAAVLWAVEKGITNGTSATTFSPDDTCSRAQFATFLWRFQGKPSAGTSNPFTDVAEGTYYTDAVLWAAENGITEGTSATTFSPDAPCTRAQAVTFLWRCLGK